MPTFHEAITVEHTDSIVRWQVTEDWAQGRTAFGGLVAAAALQAMQPKIPQERQLRSMLVTFVAPVRVGEVEIDTQLLRSGRSLTHAEIRVSQGDTLCTIVLASFGAPHERELAVTPPPIPEAKGPDDDLTEWPYIEGMMPAFTQHVAYRMVFEDALPYMGGSDPRFRGWVRFREQGQMGLAGLVGLLDTFAPPVLLLADKPVPASSVTWQINLFEDWPEEGFSYEDWWLYSSESKVSRHGYSDLEATMYSRDGRLFATARQMVVDFA